jgi:hypothetical protein
MRAHLRTAVIVLLTLGLVALFLRNANLGEVWAAILESRWDLIVIALVATSVTYLMRALRWQYLLAPIGSTRFSTAFRATVIGFSASALLPARAGEVLRPYLLARWEGLSATATLATILLERLLDLVTVVVLLASFLLLFDPGMAAMDPEVFAAVRLGGLVAAALAVGSLIAVFALAGHPERLGRWALRAERLLPPRGARALARAVERFIGGFAVIREPRSLLAAMAISFPLWGSIAIGIWLVSAAFHIVFPYPQSFVLVAMLVVGVSVPTPGAVGGFHEAYRIGATAFHGAQNDQAVAAAIVLHALSFLPVAVVGIVFMAQAGLDFRSVRRLTHEPEQTGVPATDAASVPPSPGRGGASADPSGVQTLSASVASDDGGVR